MKMNQGAGMFCLLVLCAVFPLRAQQADTNAVTRLKAKADKGDAEAQYDLGRSYAKGDGVAMDMSAAVKWWRRCLHYPAGDAFRQGTNQPRRLLFHGPGRGAGRGGRGGLVLQSCRTE